MRYIPYGRQYIDEQDIKEVVKVLKSDWISQGPKIKEFEQSLAKYCGAKYAVIVSSGTAALHLACLASGLKKGDEAITSPITFLATSNSVLYAEAKPIFADIDYNTVNIDPQEIHKKITKKTKAILPVHFAGFPCNMEEISSIARKQRLIVIEDGCHALGAEYKYNGKWIKVGGCKHSHMTVFSFHPIKSITTGEGGAILTNSKNLYEKLKALRSHGVYKDKKTMRRGPWYYEMRGMGLNYRITDFQCALGISQLNKIDKFLKMRRYIANIYNKELSGLNNLQLPSEDKNIKSSWHLYYIRLKKLRTRKKIFNLLKKNNIGVQIHYIPVYLQPYYKKLGYKKGICPNAEQYYKMAITIPLYFDMRENDIKFVIHSLKESL